MPLAEQSRTSRQARVQDMVRGSCGHPRGTRWHLHEGGRVGGAGGICKGRAHHICEGPRFAPWRWASTSGAEALFCTVPAPRQGGPSRRKPGQQHSCAVGRWALRGPVCSLGHTPKGKKRPRMVTGKHLVANRCIVPAVLMRTNSSVGQLSEQTPLPAVLAASL